MAGRSAERSGGAARARAAARDPTPRHDKRADTRSARGRATCKPKAKNGAGLVPNPSSHEPRVRCTGPGRARLSVARVAARVPAK